MAPAENIERTDADCVVVGGGLAGLTAAAWLARDGCRVVVMERNAEIGGRARTDDLDGWLFNHGAHALYREGAGVAILRSLGVEPDGGAPPLSGARAAIGGATTTLPVDARSLLTTAALTVGGKLQFGSLLARIGRLDATAHDHESVAAWLAGFRGDVAAVLAAVIRLSSYSAAPHQMSAGAAIGQLRLSLGGVLYLHGGWARLCAQLAALVRDGDGEIRTGVAADAIDGHSGGFSVRHGDETIVAPTVIVASGGPAVATTLLGLSADHFGDVGPAPVAAVLDLALDDMPTHRFVLGIDEPTYFSVHSPPARLAPEGKVAATAMRYLGPDDDGDVDSHRASLERVAALAGARTPVRSRFLRRMTVAHGVPLASRGGLTGRPSVVVNAVPGAFLAGDWVGDEALIGDAAISSGVRAAAEAGDRIVAARPCSLTS